MEDEIVVHAGFDLELNPEGNQTSQAAPWRKRTRWDVSATQPPQLNELAAQLASTHHWSQVELPDPFVKMLITLGQQGKSRDEICRKTAVLKKILSADQQCQTQTMLATLRELIFT